MSSPFLLMSVRRVASRRDTLPLIIGIAIVSAIGTVATTVAASTRRSPF